MFSRSSTHKTFVSNQIIIHGHYQTNTFKLKRNVLFETIFLARCAFEVNRTPITFNTEQSSLLDYSLVFCTSLIVVGISLAFHRDRQ